MGHDTGLGRLKESTQTRLLREDEPFLVRQLSREHYRLVIVNGRTVMRWAEAAGLVSWRCVGHLEGPPRVELYLGQRVGATFVAWSCNIQSQPGATRHAPGLAGFIAEQVGSANEGGPGLTIDRLPKGTRLISIDALVDRMRGWLEDSDADTIGAVGTFGGKPWLIVDTPLGRMKLNADTRGMPWPASSRPPTAARSAWR